MSSICRRWTRACRPISARCSAPITATCRSWRTWPRRRPDAEKRPLAGLKFALPVARPGKIICLGLNYLDHVKEGPQKDNIPKFQSIFFRMRSSLTPHLTPMMRPKESVQLDYEGEMVVIIGKRGKHLTLDNACDIVAGYACGNEGSVREYQRHTTQWGMGKNFDQTGRVRAVDGHRRRAAARRQGLENPDPSQRHRNAILQHRHVHVPGGRNR